MPPLISFQILADLNIPLHIVGDYFLQTGWMAAQKHRSSRACAFHAISYTSTFFVPVFLLKEYPSAVGCLLLIGVSHWAIDRFNVAAAVPRLRGERSADAPEWVEKVIDQGLHLISNMIAFCV